MISTGEKIQLQHIKFNQQSDVQSPQPIIQQNNQVTKKHSFYKPQIDGLRAIAVSIVVIFHAWPKFMTGGFIGVDIFFVISGYLISSIIIKEIQKQNFSYSNFYIRRIKRILPAFLFVLSIVLIIGCLVLMDLQLKLLTQTLFASTVFSANFQFIIYQREYFDPDATKNPLLHLWSLGVQEQFYFVWPLFLVITMYALKNKTFIILIFFTLISFIFSIYAVYKNLTFAFYFPLSRFWQMSIGGLIAYKKINISNYTIKNGLATVALAFILITIWIIDENSLFPGFWALVPTVSAAFIILAGNSAIVNKYILSNQLIVFVGKISYPLYLWHWPLLVFGRSLFPEGSSSIFSHPITMVILSVILSIFTYYCIQNPLRFSKPKIIVYVLLIVMILLGIISSTISKKPSQYSYLQKSISQLLKNQQDIYQDQITSQQYQKVKNQSHFIIKLKQKQLAISNYQKSIIPTINDFYNKNGKWLVNSSKNKNRKKTTQRKVMQRYKTKQFSPVLLQKRIQSNSKYFDQKLNTFSTFDILNQGQDNLLMIIGDSHAQMVAKRFVQLKKQRTFQNKQKNFPTVIAIGQGAKLMIPCHYYYDSVFQFIKKHKPRRIVFLYRWLLYLISFDQDGPLQSKQKMKNRCSLHGFDLRSQTYKDIVSYVEMFVNTVKQIKSWGIEVYVTTVKPQGDMFWQAKMIDIFGIIQENVRPTRLSQFREQYKQRIQILQNGLKNANISMIDLSQNQCWEDVCQVLTPSGYPIYADTNHYTQQYSQYWAMSLDFLTEF